MKLRPLVEGLGVDGLQVVFSPGEHVLPLPVVIPPLPVQPPSASCVHRPLAGRGEGPIGEDLPQLSQEELLQAAASLRHL